MYHSIFASHIQDHGVCLLDIPAADPEKYALACLTALFTDKELAGSCYAQTAKSTKPPLPRDKIVILEGMFCTSVYYVHILDNYMYVKYYYNALLQNVLRRSLGRGACQLIEKEYIRKLTKSA